jgi:hypothetical protein
MTRFTEERIERYRDLANIPSMDMQDDGVRAIYQRMRDEGVSIRDMRDPNVGMFMAPYRKGIEGLDIVCVGVPMENMVFIKIFANLMLAIENGSSVMRISKVGGINKFLVSRSLAKLKILKYVEDQPNSFTSNAQITVYNK